MMLKVSDKPCKLGTNASARVEYHGDDRHTALDFQLKNIMLEQPELVAFLDDPEAHKRFFERPPSGLAQPTMNVFKPFAVKDKIEGVYVELVLTEATTLKLANCNLASITLERQQGGLTALCCQVQAMPKLNDMSVARLLSRLDTDIDVTIEQEQKPLPLESHQEDDEDDEDEKPQKARRRSRNGEQPEAR